MISRSNFGPIVERHFPGARLSSAERLTGGVSADVFRLDLRDGDDIKRRVVLKSHRGTDCGQSAKLEFDVIKFAFKAGLPVPEPLCVDTTRDLLERPFLLIAFVESSSAPALCGAGTSIDTMADMLAWVHRTATKGLPALPHRLDPVPELLDFLPACSKWQELRGFLCGLDNTVFSGKPAMLHGDFWPANLIWENNAIVAILDWEDAAIGDPLSDVACTCLELRYIHGEDGMRRFQNAYSRHRSIEPHRFALWSAYVAAAAYHFMGNWGLEPSREHHMRQTAVTTIREAAAFLLSNRSDAIKRLD